MCLTVGFQLDTVRRYLAVRDGVRVGFARVAFGPRLFIRGLWDVESFGFGHGSTDTDVERVRGFPFANWGSVSYDSRVTDSGLRRLAPTELSTFELRNESITDEGIRFLRECPQLTYLYLDGSKLTDDGLAVLKGKRNLSQLMLANTAVNGSALRHLNPACRLSYVDLSQTKTDDRALKYLRPLPVATVLLRGTLIEGDGLKQLAQCRSLRRLDLSNTKLRENYLDDLVGSASLARLILDGVPLTVRGIEPISRIPALEQLHITHTGVDDESLKPLQKSRNLQYVRVDADRLTPAGYAFISHVPAIDLEYDGNEMSLLDITQSYLSLAEMTRPTQADDLGFVIWNLTISEQMLPKLAGLEARYDLVVRSPRIRGSVLAPPNATVTVAEIERSFRNRKAAR